MSNIAIFYGSTTGNTETVANELGDQLGAPIFNVSSSPVAEIEKYDTLIFGTSTWGVGDLQDDWEEFIGELSSVDLTGKFVGLFGTGDGYSYSDSFVDGIGKIYEALESKGCTVVGKVSTDGYDYDSSEAEVDGMFVGLPIDEDNESDQTPDRIKSWVEQIKQEIG